MAKSGAIESTEATDFMKNKLFFGSALTVLCGLVLPPVCVPVLAAPASETATSRLPADLARADAGREVIACDLGSVEARYVKIDFNTQSTGKIAAINLFGLAGSVSKAESKGKFHVSLTTPASANVEASFVFDAAAPAAQVVADFGAQKSLERLTCAYEAPAGSLEFYLVDNLNEQERVGLNYIGEPSVQPVSNDGASANVLADRKAIYTVDTTAQPDGKVTADLSGLQGRYLVAAFRPAARHRAADGKDAGDYKNAAVEGKDKDSKAAPVFPAFTSSPAGFGNSPGDSNTPLTPPPIGANSL